MISFDEHRLNSVLHTYGSPRLYSITVINGLPDITHYRHINGSDVVPRVSPEANLESYLLSYKTAFTALLSVFSLHGYAKMTPLRRQQMAKTFISLRFFLKR
ncbi:hypothetical protein [Providencia stuartii]|uniref:hypothetical protein n=1 Tax=Providencia stuartii TaxID=588 RepID=UPI0018C4C48C|nr:hypothetical protein [Providencia stuartii]MBG5920958.1 hypothetical protein [Providencia stuartii]